MKHKIWLHSYQPTVSITKKVLIIGAGLAGCSAAYAMAKRGWIVDILDKASAPATGASSNQQAILTVKPSNAQPLIQQLWSVGQAYTQQVLHAICGESIGEDWDWPGVLHLHPDDKMTLTAYKQSHDHISNPLKTENESDQDLSTAIYSGGWVNLSRFCNQLLQHQNITFKGSLDIISIDRINQNWQLKTSNQAVFSTTALIIANSYLASQLFANLKWPSQVMRGQISYVPETQQSATWKMILQGRHYLTPAFKHWHSVGATNQLGDYSLLERASDHETNWFHLLSDAPELAQALMLSNQSKPSMMTGWVGLRSVTPDKLPIIGPVVNTDIFCKQYARLQYDANAQFEALPVYLPQCYVTIGHGFRGLTTAPLGGEYIAAALNGETSMLPELLLQSMHPSRFLARCLIRRTLNA
ncbi:MAG: FAD-dependent 5-carboxymethylaminomethyl-2-thiouridine(34) oxidoreductase MnmC [Endozoicomonadaceae bacterium]|nr:FAD-dependent 5-carboxymethylaminomethyl-2-thiouridine(34) oxidoreductase MnmC [Endozoicomonadaceae bacterium]